MFGRAWALPPSLPWPLFGPGHCLWPICLIGPGPLLPWPVFGPGHCLWPICLVGPGPSLPWPLFGPVAPVWSGPGPIGVRAVWPGLAPRSCTCFNQYGGCHCASLMASVGPFALESCLYDMVRHVPRHVWSGSGLCLQHRLFWSVFLRFLQWSLPEWVGERVLKLVM